MKAKVTVTVVGDGGTVVQHTERQVEVREDPQGFIWHIISAALEYEDMLKRASKKEK